MPYALRKYLVECYGGFADKRIKKVETGRIFAVDGRSKGDYASDGSFFGWFCVMTLEVDEDQKVQLYIGKHLPSSLQITGFFHEHSHDLRSDYGGAKIWTIIPQNVGLLLELSRLVENIVAPGQHCETKSDKYVCPRVSACLRKLHKVLTAYWNDAGYVEKSLI